MLHHAMMEENYSVLAHLLFISHESCSLSFFQRCSASLHHFLAAQDVSESCSSDFPIILFNYLLNGKPYILTFIVLKHCAASLRARVGQNL